MGMNTTYDNMRDHLREKLNECYKESLELLDEDTWGYEDMREDYAFDVIKAIKEAKKAI